MQQTSLRFLFVALALAGTTRPVRGQTVDAYWNAPIGGAGTWDTTTQSWSLIAGGPVNYTWLNSANERANFGNAPGLVTLGTAITAFGVNFSTSGYDITGNTLTFAGAGGGGIDTGSFSATLSATVDGAIGLTKAGSGELTLGGTNLYTGLTTVSAGTLTVANSAGLGAGGAGNETTVNSGAALRVNGAGLTVAEPLTIDGTGIANAGALRNSGDNTFSGPITLGAAGARINADNGTLTLSGAITGAGPVTIGGAGNTTISLSNGLAIGAGTLNKDGSGTLTITAGQNFTGPVNIDGGVVSIASTLMFGTAGRVTINGGTLRQTNPGNAGSFISATREIAIGPLGGTVDYSSSNPSVGLVSIYSGTITGIGNTLTKVGAGEFRYNGAGRANTSFAKLVINQGLFRLGDSGAGNNFETGFGAAPASFLADAITLNGGAIGVSFGATIIPNRGITLGPNGGTFNMGGAPLVVSSVISGGGSLTKIGGQQLTLDAANTYTGPTNVNAGTLLVSANGSFASSSAYNIASGATLNVSAVTAGLAVGPGQVLSGAGTLNGVSSIAGGTVAPGASIGTLTQSTQTMTLGFGGRYNFEHVIAPATPLAPVAGTDNDTLVGSGTTVLDLQGLTPNSFTIELMPTNFTGAPTTTVFTAATFAGGVLTPAGLPTVALANGIGAATDISSLIAFTGSFNPNFAPIAAVDGTVLYLQFTPVPEPVHILLLSAGVLGIGGWVRRRRAAA